MKTLTAKIASVNDRENLVYEIWCEDTQLAEVSKEPGCEYVIEIFAARNSLSWRVDLNEFKAMLEQGVKELATNP